MQKTIKVHKPTDTKHLFLTKDQINLELQYWPKYMRQTLVLVWNSALREKFNFNF